jgi:acyl carrier protein
MEDKIRAIVAATLGVPIAGVDAESSPQTLQMWDSTNHIRIVLAVEDAFGIEFNEEQIVEMTTVQRLVAGVRTLAKI